MAELTEKDRSRIQSLALEAFSKQQGAGEDIRYRIIYIPAWTGAVIRLRLRDEGNLLTGKHTQLDSGATLAASEAFCAKLHEAEQELGVNSAWKDRASKVFLNYLTASAKPSIERMKAATLEQTGSLPLVEYTVSLAKENADVRLFTEVADEELTDEQRALKAEKQLITRELMHEQKGVKILDAWIGHQADQQVGIFSIWNES